MLSAVTLLVSSPANYRYYSATVQQQQPGLIYGTFSRRFISRCAEGGVLRSVITHPRRWPPPMKCALYYKLLMESHWAKFNYIVVCGVMCRYLLPRCGFTGCCCGTLLPFSFPLNGATRCNRSVVIISSGLLWWDVSWIFITAPMFQWAQQSFRPTCFALSSLWHLKRPY